MGISDDSTCCTAAYYSARDNRVAVLYNKFYITSPASIRELVG